MHAQPSMHSASPRYNCILKRGATSSESSWKTVCLQMIGCTWRCWYCYVDTDLLSGNSSKGRFLTFSEMVEIIRNSGTGIVDLTGGQPDLVPEWPLALETELNNDPSGAGNYHIRTEDNLNNDFLWRFLSDFDVSRLASSPNHTHIGCFKGFNDESLRNSTRTAVEGSYSTQMLIARRLFESGFEPYYYAVFPVAHTDNLEHDIHVFFHDLQKIVEWLPLRVVPLKLRPTTTWQQKTSSDYRPDYEDIAHEIWFALVEKHFGRVAFETELKEVLI